MPCAKNRHEITQKHDKKLQNHADLQKSVTIQTKNVTANANPKISTVFGTALPDRVAGALFSKKVRFSLSILQAGISAAFTASS